MSRSDTEREITQTLGQVPDFFKDMPDDTLEREWQSWRSFQLEDTALTAREKHLIGLGVAAAIHCPYCTYFHRAAATMMGASEAQCEEAARFAADTSKYSTYLHGLQTSIDDFRRQADEMGEHLSSHQQGDDVGQGADPDAFGAESPEGTPSLSETRKDLREQAA
jgi:AhpD family alkylhydroperoxidase